MGAIPVTPYRPQQENMLDQLMRFQQAKNQQQQGQMQGLEIQKEQQALKDQQAMTAAMQNWDGKDISALPPLVIKHGGSATAVIGLKSKILEQQQTYSNIAKNDAETGSKQLETLKQKNDMVLGRLNSLNDVPDAQLPGELTKAASELAQSGLIDPQHAQMAAELAKQDPASIRAQIGSFAKGYQSQSQQMDAALKSAQTKEATARAGEAEAQTKKVQQETQFGPTGAAAESRYRSILGQISAGQSPSDADLNFAKSYELANRKTTTSSDTLGVTSSNTSGPSGLAAVSRSKLNGGSTPSAAPGGTAAAQPSAKQSIVDMVGTYRMNPTLLQRMVVKHPDVIAAVNQKYPDWDQTTYNAKNKLIMGYTSGTQSKEINAINTAMGHVGVLDDAVDALNNNNVRVLNAIANRLGIEVGQSPQATFKLIVHRVGPEISSAYVPGGGGQAERFANEEDFSENLAPGILHNNAAVTVKLLRSKVGALENQYKNTVGRDDFQQKFIQPEAQKAFDKFAPKGGSSGPTKSLTKAQVQKAADDHKMSYADAAAQATAQGYLIQ